AVIDRLWEYLLFAQLDHCRPHTLPLRSVNGHLLARAVECAQLQRCCVRTHLMEQRFLGASAVPVEGEAVYAFITISIGYSSRKVKHLFPSHAIRRKWNAAVQERFL